MPNYSKPDVLLVRFPFSDLTSSKVRPAIVINAPHTSQDLFVVAQNEQPAFRRIRFEQMAGGGLKNVETTVKRGIFTIKESLVRKRVGKLDDTDTEQLEKSLRIWLDLQ